MAFTPGRWGLGVAVGLIRRWLARIFMGGLTLRMDHGSIGDRGSLVVRRAASILGISLLNFSGVRVCLIWRPLRTAWAVRGGFFCARSGGWDAVSPAGLGRVSRTWGQYSLIETKTPAGSVRYAALLRMLANGGRRRLLCARLVCRLGNRGCG